MKKFFTLFAAGVMTLAASAATESFGAAQAPSAKDTEAVCPGFTIAANYVAGGTSKANVYNGDKGMKLRANQTDNTLVLTVDENTTITAIKMGVVVNDAEQSFPIADVLVDGVSVALTYPIALPCTADADGAAIIDLAEISASENISIKFNLDDYTAKNKQVFIAGEVTFDEAGSGPEIVTGSGVWAAPEEAPAAGSVLVDNELLKATTVYETGVSADAVTLAGQEFGYRMNVRVDAWPNADNLNGTEKGGSTPVIIEAKQDLDITFAFRRQYKDGYTAGDGKDIAVFSHPAATRVDGEMVEINDLDGSYGNCTEKFTLPAGTYTVCAKGTTLGLFGFVYEAKGTSSIATVASDNTEAVYYNLNGMRVANPANGLYIKVQGGKASKVLVK